MSTVDWGGFTNNALNTSLALWAAQEQAKLGHGSSIAPAQQAAVVGVSETDNGVKQGVAASGGAWYQRRSVQLVGGAVVVAGVLYAAFRSRGRR